MFDVCVFVICGCCYSYYVLLCVLCVRVALFVFVVLLCCCFGSVYCVVLFWCVCLCVFLCV